MAEIDIDEEQSSTSAALLSSRSTAASPTASAGNDYDEESFVEESFEDNHAHKSLHTTLSEHQEHDASHEHHTSLSNSYGTDSFEADEDENAYENDAFEEKDQGEKDHYYDDDAFEDNSDTKQSIVQKAVASAENDYNFQLQSLTTDNVPILQSKSIEKKSQHADRWCFDKIQHISTSNTKRRLLKQRSVVPISSPNMSPVTISSLILQVQTQRSAIDLSFRVNSSRSPEVAVPKALLYRAHTQRFLSTLSTSRLEDSTNCTNGKIRSASDPSGSLQLPQRSISTFCSVKQADLQGRLATERLDQWCRKWAVPSENTDAGNTMAMATTTYIGEMFAKQQGIYAIPNLASQKSHEHAANKPISHYMQSQARYLDIRALETRLCLEESIKTRQRAARVLSGSR